MKVQTTSWPIHSQIVKARRPFKLAVGGRWASVYDYPWEVTLGIPWESTPRGTPGGTPRGPPKGRPRRTPRGPPGRPPPCCAGANLFTKRLIIIVPLKTSPNNRFTTWVPPGYPQGTSPGTPLACPGDSSQNQFRSPPYYQGRISGPLPLMTQSIGQARMLSSHWPVYRQP